jgi:hypothetical protein
MGVQGGIYRPVEARVRSYFTLHKAVLGIRIRIRRIRMFLGFSDPDPLVRGTDPDASPPHKCVERTEIMSAK